jgi:GT2 family glycosyltransferase
MKIFGMVTTRASDKYTLPALESFFRHTPIQPEDAFYLIDNDNSWEAPSGPLAARIKIIRNQQPKGFAANANQAVDLALSAKADLYFLNNDLIFPKNWITPLLVDDTSILSPLSPRELQYATSMINTKTKGVSSTFVITNPMDLETYLESPAAFDYVAEVHRKNAEGYWSIYTAPFFCIKIPYAVLKAVGHLDESYGVGGGEDYDYCLRAILAGFSVKCALASYILHFGGKSTWAGPEDAARREAREEQFMRVFEAKWGSKLFQLILRERSDIVTTSPELNELQQAGRLKEVVEKLLKDGTKPVH